MTARSKNRHIVVVAEQPIGGRTHMHQVLALSADAAQYAEDALYEKRRLHQSAVAEMSEIVKVPNVIALELEFGPVCAEFDDAAFDLPERIREDEIPRHLEIGLLPIVFELGDLPRRCGNIEIERSHVHRGDLGLSPFGRRETFVEGHAQPAAGGDIDHGVAFRLDVGEELFESVGILGRPASLLDAGMEM